MYIQFESLVESIVGTSLRKIKEMIGIAADKVTIYPSSKVNSNYFYF